MWKDRLDFFDPDSRTGEEIMARIRGLAALGCGLLRFAVPDIAAANVLGALASRVSMPLVADIHFDYKIALRCLDFPIAKLRINPGNIGAKDKVTRLLAKAAGKNVPIRIGVNGGSLPQDLRKAVDSGATPRAQALVEAAEREKAVFDEAGFSAVVVSMKASSVAETIASARLFAERNDTPLHLGVTEAGPLVAGVVRNTAALHPLLCAGLGDTIRVSLSDTMENEVIAAREILLAVSDTLSQAVSDTHLGVRIVSCPRCGRCAFDTHAFTARWQRYLYALDKNVTVAIMGCAVNGPEEARHADLGITGAGNKTLLFRKGRVVRTIDNAAADAAFQEELERL
jgi:(E)-4-hydroxy-3-methylbut-2-enyl-diphosphate synthase